MARCLSQGQAHLPTLLGVPPREEGSLPQLPAAWKSKAMPRRTEQSHVSLWPLWPKVLQLWQVSP